MKHKGPLFLLLLLLLALSACKSSSGTSNSYNLNSAENSAICGPMNYGDNLGFSAKMKTLGSSASAGFYDYVQIKLSSMPQSFKNGTTYLQFYRYWFTQNSANANTDNAPLNIEIVSANNPTYPLLTGVTSFSLADLNSYNINDLVVVVEVGGSSYHALEMVLFDSNNQEIGSNFGLLPPYTAKPETYQSQKSNYGVALGTMMKLHPYQNQKNLGDDSYYVEKSYGDFCFNGLFTN